MRVPHLGVRSTRRRLLRAGLVAATAALLVAPLPASAEGLYPYYAPTPTPYGWYPYSSVQVQVVADVDGFVSDPDDGDHDEILLSVECTGTGVSGGFAYDGTARASDTVVYVTIQGPTSITGAGYGCVATYQRRYYSSCHSVLGIHWCDTISPFEDNQFTRTIGGRVYLDDSPPDLVTAIPSSQPNAAGWYRTTGTVDFVGRDPESGVPSCTRNVPFGGSSSAFIQGVGGSCTNAAGLQRNGSFTYKFDNVAPSLAPSVSPSIVALNGSATASANATDQHSGIRTQGCDPVDTSTPGAHTVSCSATDNADNSASNTATYTVGYTSSGFDQQVDAGARNVAKAGRSIPLKWRVTDGAGVPITNLSSVSVTASSMACSAGTTGDQVEEYASGDSGLQNLGDGFYQFNWSTPKAYAGSCKTLSVDLGDGIARTAAFEFTK